MTTHRVGIIMHGATGGLARKHHVGSLVAIRKEGGLPLPSGDRIMPDPIFVGRSAERLAVLAAETGVTRTSTDLKAALADANDTVFFDAAATALRFDVVSQAIEAGKHIYCEKPIAGSTEQAMELVRKADGAGVKHGTVQDKLFLPGFANLQMVVRSGFLGRILEVRLEMGRWIFDGTIAGWRAAELELPEERRRRPHPRYVPALALHAGRADRSACRGELPLENAGAEAGRRGRQCL